MPTSSNPALTIAGPCILVYKGVGFYSKADVPVALKEDLADLPSSAYGVVGKIATNQLFEITLTPVGTLDCLDVLYPAHLRNFSPGRLVHDTRKLGAVSLVSGELTLTAHNFREGAMVRLASFGTLPTGWSSATRYFLHKKTASADIVTLHTSASDAAAGTNPVIPTVAGTGDSRIIEEETLTIWSINDEKGYVFANAAITKLPGFKAAVGDTAIKDVTFTCYRSFSSDPTGNAFYTTTTTAPDVDFDPDAIVTQAYNLAWGDTAPWSAMPTAAGVEIDFALSLTAVPDQVGGIMSHRVELITPTAKARPRNITEDHILAKRVFQGAGAGNGRRISGGDDLHISGDGLYIILYNSGLTDSPYGYDGKEDRARDFTWTAFRKFTAGVPQALFYIGTEAPV